MTFAGEELDVSIYFTNCKAREKAVGPVRVYPANILNHYLYMLDSFKPLPPFQINAQAIKSFGR